MKKISKEEAKRLRRNELSRLWKKANPKKVKRWNLRWQKAQKRNPEVKPQGHRRFEKGLTQESLIFLVAFATGSNQTCSVTGICIPPTLTAK